VALHSLVLSMGQSLLQNGLFQRGKVSVGDLSEQLGFAEGSPVKVALHAAVGAAVAAMAGTDVGAGALAGALSEIANAALQEVLKADPNLTDEQKNAITQWIAVAVGAAAGGQGGAAAALDNVNHNYLYHQEQMLREKAKKELARCEAGDNCTNQEKQSLKEQVAYWDDLDAQRNLALTTACDADASGPACVSALQDALMSIGYIPKVGGPLGIFGGTEYNGYQELQQRLSNGGFANPETQKLAEAVLAGRLQTIELLEKYSEAASHALTDFAKRAMIDAAIMIVSLGIEAKMGQPGLGNTKPKPNDQQNPPNGNGTSGGGGSNSAYPVIVVDGAGNANVVINGVKMSDHARIRATERNISIENIKTAMDSKPFQYLEKGKWHDGYYDAKTNTFVGVGDDITTVIKPKNPTKYIANLKARQ
ncbi:DUF6862 domain-containing protein, partial [Rhizobium sp. CFBP 13717]